MEKTTSIDLTGKKVIVLDVHGIVYQVFHTMREMSGPKGQPTGAAFGFIRDVMTLLNKFHPDYVFCAFDMPGETFRHRIYPAYKANRPEMPEDLKPQMIFVRELVDALCVARLEKEGFEADDLLATVARRTEEANGEAILVTSDKDARQLITDKVSLYNLRKELLYDAGELLKDWGIRPDQVIDFQTMVGDSTDNIPGIHLIGPKGATQLLNEYGTLEGVFDHLDELKGKKKENIAASRDRVGITRQLVRLDPDVPIGIDWEEGRFHGVDPDRLTALFKEFGFRSLLPRIKELIENFGVGRAKTDSSLIGLVDLMERSAGDSPREPERGLFDGRETSEDGTTSSGGDGEGTLAEESGVTEAFFHALRTARKGSGPEAGEGTGTPDFPVTDAFNFDRYPEDVVYSLIDTPELFESFLTSLRAAPVISVDLETVDCEQVTSRVHPRFAKIAGIALCFDAKTGYYLPIRGPVGSRLLPERETLEALRPILESDRVRKIGQNIKFDMIVFRNVGIRLQGVFFDTMVADYLLHAGEQRHNLDDLAANYLGYETMRISELIGTGKNQKRMDEVPTEQVARYAGEDALVPWFLYPRLLESLRKDPALLRLLTELEIPLIDVLVELETNGIAIDPEHFAEQSKALKERLDRLETEIRELAADVDPDPDFGKKFNINSTQQLQRILFDDLNLPVVKKTKTGRSTDLKVLEELAQYHPLPEKLIEHRRFTKLQGTYIDPLPLLRHPVTGRIHASFNQVVTATGRLSSSDPNLQNVPVRSEEGKLIRSGFVPDASLGFDTFLSCDYSQIELRILTHFSKDENLTAAFERDLDIHSHVASELFGVPLDQVTSEMRRKAKAVNFGLVYGQSAFGLAGQLKIPQSEAAEYIRKFFETYPGIHRFFDRVLEDCRRNGFVRTILGRRRAIDGVRGARGDKPLNMAERNAINTVIQGSAADLMKIAMVNVATRLHEIGGERRNPTPTNFRPILPSGKMGIETTETEMTREISPPSRIEVPKQGEFLFDDKDEETGPEDPKTEGANFPSLFDSLENRNGEETRESRPLETAGGDDSLYFTPEPFLPKARLLLQIHDELLLETTANDAPELARIVSKEMELGQPLSVPLKIDAAYGPVWDF